MQRDPMKDILASAGAMFRDEMRQVDIEEFFDDRGITLAEGNSKATYASNTLASLSQDQALSLILEQTHNIKNYDLQEEIYFLQDKCMPKISEITRREIAKVMDRSFHVQGVNVEYVSGIFKLEDDISVMLGEPSALQILQTNSSGANPEWCSLEVFQFIGALRCSSRRFIQFLETAFDPIVRSEAEQSELLGDLAPILAKDGYQIVMDASVSGRSIYRIHEAKRGVLGAPKNLIFASNGPKPRLGFSDAVNNDIVVLEHENSCLIYDQPIRDGLSWQDLVVWWSACQGLSVEEGRKTLGYRLQQSLDSGPELEFFAAYFRIFRDRLSDRLPALIPQVYLHYDPEIASRLKDREGLFRQRMDFLLLLPGKQRIVLEIDGKHHYANADRADPKLYAKMISADRDLRLRGYEVYRFGGSEFVESKGDTLRARSESLVDEFFSRLFSVHKLI